MYVQVIKSVIAICIGSAVGIAIYLNTGQVSGLIVAGLGGFIGFGLSLPSTSLARVAQGTAGAIVANNVPAPLASKVFDAFIGEREIVGADAPHTASQDISQLPQYDGIISVEDPAAAIIRDALDSNALDKQPMRIIATINEAIPPYLHYDLSVAFVWDPAQDVLCVANNVQFVLDELTVLRITGTKLTVKEVESQERLSFENPNWPRDDLSKEPWQDNVPEEYAQALLARPAVEHRLKPGAKP